MGDNGGPPMGMDPETAIAIVREAVAIRQRRDMIDRVGKTAEILFQHTIDTAVPSFKSRMKQGVRRAATTGVAWIKLDFERSFSGHTTETKDRIADIEDRIRKADAILGTLKAGEIPEGDARREEMKLMLDEITSKEDMVQKEGILFDFPKSWDVIPDDECTQIVGLIGCKKLAHQFEGTVDSIKAAFNVDVGQCFTPYRADGNPKPKADDTPDKVHWYEIYDSTAGLVYTVCEGYPDFLCDPAPPRVEVPQFFPFYPIVLNEVENDEKLYPLSDVDLIKHQQKELNRTREALRQHRIAAQPYLVGDKSKLSEDDQNRLKNRAAHDVILLQALVGGQKVGDMLQAGPTNPIDPNLYTDQFIVQDMLRAGGQQEANLGPTSKGTATEAGIAESSRSATVSSNVDDIDTALSLMARDATLVMFKGISPETAKKIAGPGAVWPELAGNDIAGELYLSVIAGSSGKPNREREAAAFERIVPMAVQIPGINPKFMARKAVELMDDAVDIEDAILDGIPSIIAMNAALKPTGGGGAGGAPTGNPQTDPNQQGAQGADNGITGPGVPGGAQAGHPSPTDTMTG